MLVAHYVHHFINTNIQFYIQVNAFQNATHPAAACCCSSTNADLPGICTPGVPVVVVPPSIYLGVCGASGASMPDCGVLGGPS